MARRFPKPLGEVRFLGGLLAVTDPPTIPAKADSQLQASGAGNPRKKLQHRDLRRDSRVNLAFLMLNEVAGDSPRTASRRLGGHMVWPQADTFQRKFPAMGLCGWRRLAESSGEAERPREGPLLITWGCLSVAEGPRRADTARRPFFNHLPPVWR
jgi:hypothetical protein